MRHRQEKEGLRSRKLAISSQMQDELQCEWTRGRAVAWGKGAIYEGSRRPKRSTWRVRPVSLLRRDVEGSADPQHLYLLAPCGKPACPPAPAGAPVEVSTFEAAAAAGTEAAASAAGPEAAAAGPEAVAAAGASLGAALELAAASDEAGAADSSLRLLHADRIKAASRDAMRRDFFTITPFRGESWEPKIIPLSCQPAPMFQVYRERPFDVRGPGLIELLATGFICFIKRG